MFRLAKRLIYFIDVNKIYGQTRVCLHNVWAYVKLSKSRPLLLTYSSTQTDRFPSYFQCKLTLEKRLRLHFKWLRVIICNTSNTKYLVSYLNNMDRFKALSLIFSCGLIDCSIFFSIIIINDCGMMSGAKINIKLKTHYRKIYVFARFYI